MKLFKVFVNVFIIIFLFLLVSSCSQRSIPGLEAGSGPLSKQRRAGRHATPVGNNIKTKYYKPKGTLSIDRMF